MQVKPISKKEASLQKKYLLIFLSEDMPGETTNHVWQEQNSSTCHTWFFKKRNCFKNNPLLFTAILAPKRENTAKNNIHSSLLFAVLSLCRRNRCLTLKQSISF